MKHIHAELMMKYAKDAMETDKPWERWEWGVNDKGWVALEKNPTWLSMYKYRRKLNGKTVVIDGQEFIVPKSFKPAMGELFWFFDTNDKDVFESENAGGFRSCYALAWGNCYRTKEEAEQALAFWRKVNEV